MPSIKDQSTVEAIARIFCDLTQGNRNKSKTLELAGYTKAYANSYCGKMWENKRLISAIARLDAKMAAETSYTIKKYQEELESARGRAQILKQPSAEVSAIVAKGRSCGYDKDAHADRADAPPAIPDEDLPTLRAIAKAITNKELDGPKLVKEAQ